jgi:hypothetical protein
VTSQFPKQADDCKLFGFTFLRNGVKYDYPFQETLKTLLALCDSVYLALGDSDDGTETKITKDQRLKILHTKWDETLRSGGLILSEQTNQALQFLERDQDSGKGWALYLQCDEVIPEWDFLRLKEDLKNAEACGADAIRFRYLHFWETPHQIAIAKRWYPTEIRCIRLGSGIRSSGDAQSFSGCSNIYDSEVCVFHYGHVRKKEAWELKKHDFHHWYHTDTTIGQIRARSQESDLNEPVVQYLGPHPSVMQERLESFDGSGGVDSRTVIVIDQQNSLDQQFLDRVAAAKVVRVTSRADARTEASKHSYPLVVSTTPRWWHPKETSRLRRRGSPFFPAQIFLALELSRFGVQMRTRK